MTKEDEARLAEIRAKRFVTGPGWLEISFLLRLLDEQAARVAALLDAGDALAQVLSEADGLNPDGAIALLGWSGSRSLVDEAAIRARAGEKEGT